MVKPEAGVTSKEAFFFFARPRGWFIIALMYSDLDILGANLH
jgi:hypothetical protein